MFPVRKKKKKKSSFWNHIFSIFFLLWPSMCLPPHHFCPLISVLFIISPSVCPLYMHDERRHSLPARFDSCRPAERLYNLRSLALRPSNLAPCRLRANPATACRNTSPPPPSLRSSTLASCKSLHPPAAPSTTSVSTARLPALSLFVLQEVASSPL